ncbi:MAG TPA: DUF4142 domain-containing protein [Flavitalea sp.]|nr:DUF4142 domain-containing protein [Flavitalea sp.]
MKVQLRNTAVYLLMSTSLFLGACNDDSTATDNKSDSSTVANNSNNNANDSATINSGDREFISDMIAGNMAEIRLAQLAQTKGTSPEIKQIAKTLETDHTAALNQLKDLASRKGVTAPAEETNDAKDTYNNLNEKSAKDFDREWCEKLMDKHDKSIKKFQDKTEDNNADADLKTWATNILPKLRSHHDQLMACHNKLKK